jgi:hypothetical protein
MKFNSQQLLEELREQTLSFIKRAEELQLESFEKLNWKENPTSWSVLECLEHLNLYGDFYIPELRKQLQTNVSTSETTFKSGILGNYFAKSMLPKEKLNKMKTFKDKNPVNSQLTIQVIERFIQQQNQLLELLDLAKSKNLNAIKTKITIPLIKLKVGDTFRFLINHNVRHFEQLEDVLGRIEK